MADERHAAAAGIVPRARDERLTVEFTLRGRDDPYPSIRIPELLKLRDDVEHAANDGARDSAVCGHKVILRGPCIRLFCFRVGIWSIPEEENPLGSRTLLERRVLVEHLPNIPVRASLRAGGTDEIRKRRVPVDVQAEPEQSSAFGQWDARNLRDDAELLGDTHRSVADRIANCFRDLPALVGSRKQTRELLQ